MKVLFVCTGNTCRSPMAEALCRHLVARRGFEVTCSSAGTAALPGDSAAVQARAVLEERGIDLQGHRARALSPAAVDEADLVLAMTAAHKDAILKLAPAAAGKVHTLGEYVGGGDVPDPFGGPPERYRETAARLEHMLEALLDRLQHDAAAGMATEPTAASRREERQPMLVGLGCDHGGVELKAVVKQVLADLQLPYSDFGTHSRDSVDYPDFARAVALAVRGGECDFGVLICGTGIGIAIAANKVPGIRAATCNDPYSARMAREHNDANILCLGGRIVGPGLAEDIVRAFFTGAFAGGRHTRRVDKIHAIEDEFRDSR